MSKTDEPTNMQHDLDLAFRALDGHVERMDGLSTQVADLRTEIEQLQEAVNEREPVSELLEQLNELREKFYDFQASVALAMAPADTASAAVTWRERVSVDSTVKDGFRVKDATLEVSYPEGAGPTRDERQARLWEVIEDGQAVADQKNHEKQQQQRFGN